MTPYIVAEISKNWEDGTPMDGSPLTIAGLFEGLIEHNRMRGYQLYTFQLHRLMVNSQQMNETIIAVFARHDPPH